MIVAGLAGVLISGSPAPAQTVMQITAVAGEAWGINNTILVPIPNPPSPDGTPLVQIPPPPCPTTEADDTAQVIQLGPISVGLIHVDTSCSPALPSELGFVESNADVANATIASALPALPGLPLLPPVLRLGAVHAECRSGRLPNGSIGSTEDVTVASLDIGGVPVNVGSLGRNTVIDLSALIGIRIVLNEVVETNTPTSTSIVVNAVRITVTNGGLLGPLLGNLPLPLPAQITGELIIGHVECSAQFAVVPPTTTTTTAPPATTTTTAPPATTTTTAPPATTTTTAAPGTTTSTTAAPGTTTSTTAAATTTTAKPATTTSTTLPPTGTSPTTVTTLPPAVTTTAPPGILVRTGSNLQPLALLSGLSIVLGFLLLVGSGRPLTANVGPASSVGVGLYDGPEKWGPVEIAKTIWAGVAVLLLAVVNIVRGGRGRNSG